MAKVKKITKSKATKQKKELVIVPRLRLEPRLTPKPSKKNESKHNKNTDSMGLLRANEIAENSCQAATLDDEPCEEIESDYERENEASCILNNSSDTKANINCKESTDDDQSSDYEPEDDDDDDDDDWGKKTVKKQRKVCVPKKRAIGKIESVVVPKLRLGPRPALKSCKKNKDKQAEGIKDNLRFLRTEIGENSSQAESSDNDSCAEMRKNYEQESRVSNVLNNSSAIEKNMNCEAENAQSSKYVSEEEEDFDNITVTRQRRRLVQRSRLWNDRELMDLAIGLQCEGFGDLKKIADYVKTKNENDIRHYIGTRSVDARNKCKAKQPGRPKMSYRWNSPTLENISTWPNSRKWRKFAYEQMLPLIRSKDYSKPVISALCRKFYEEEKEPTDPQVINVKLIYKYMMDCMSGDIPPQLPPKESALVLDLLREVRSIPIANDFEEELKFLNDFKGATKFKPFHVKDEFKKRFRKEHSEEDLGPNTVPVPEDVFLKLSRHKKLLQSFNPLVTPVWMLQKEQEILEKYSKESNVYVD